MTALLNLFKGDSIGSGSTGTIDNYTSDGG